MIAFDTNVLMYCFDQADPRKQKISRELVSQSGEGVLLWQVAVEFLSLSRKLDRSPHGVSLAFERIDNFRQSLPLVMPSASVLEITRKLMAGSQVQFWDAVIHAACLEAGVSAFYTEDVPGQQLSGLSVINPFA